MRIERPVRLLAVGVALLASVALSPVGAEATTGLPSSFRWESSGQLIAPQSDATHSIVSIKDPSIVFFKGRWNVYASVANAAGNYSMVYTSFHSWSRAGAAPQFYLDTNPNIGTGYRAAPQVFFFAPQHRWYLVYQTGAGGSFSTTSDPTRPDTWSAPRNFYAAMPDIIRQNIGKGFWVDFWVICDSVNCFLFSSDDNGHLYRSQTTATDFPNGFGNTVIVLSDPNRFRVFEASNVYRVEHSHSYLLLVEAIGSDGRRYFRSWTSPSLAGTWTGLADSEANPFSRSTNVTFDGTPWTNDISHGEMIRDGIDQTLTIDPHHLRYLYQGLDPGSHVPYNSLPWRLGLLSETRSTDD
jgi:endo-1,4-beta-xylanase